MHRFKSTHRRGLTVLEVLFSMVVILVGLVGVALMIPLAGRQAEDSKAIAQGLAAGKSIVSAFEANQYAKPAHDNAWVYIDDAPGAYGEYRMDSIRAVYNTVAGRFPVPATPLAAAISQNEAIGIGVCIDPMFWGFHPRLADPYPTSIEPFRKVFFPYYNDTTSPLTPVTGAPAAPPIPRLARISFANPSSYWAPNAYGTKMAIAPGSWIGQSAAMRLSTVFGGDLVQEAAITNRSLGPIRSATAGPAGTGSLLINAANSANQASWMATLTPADSTPVIPLSVVSNSGTAESLKPVIIPNVFDCAVVVFSKRDPREVLFPINLLSPQAGERVAQVTAISTEAVSTGSFSIEIAMNPQFVDPRLNNTVRVGDWLMMSRWAPRDLTPRTEVVPAPGVRYADPAGTFMRQVHRWYRIVNATRPVVGAGGNIYTTLRLSGQPWGWTAGEISDRLEQNRALTEVGYPNLTLTPDPTVFNTQVVLLKDVIQVFERQIELE